MGESEVNVVEIMKLYEAGFLEGSVIETFDVKVPHSDLEMKGQVVEFKGGACIVEFQNGKGRLTAYFKSRAEALKYVAEMTEPYRELQNLHREISNRKNYLQHLKHREKNVKEEMQNRLNDLREEIEKTERSVKKLEEAFKESVEALHLV